MADDKLAGRAALVTGGSGGIGRALVARLARAGCHVALSYASGAASAHQAVAEASAAGVRAVALPADLTQPDAAVTLARQATEGIGRIDVLIPNAGLSVRADLAGVDLALWQHTLAVNLTAPFLLAQQLLPGMAERGFGRLLFLSSTAAFTGGMVGPHYAASKAGLHGLVYWLAARYASHGITVNALAPALIEGTAMMPATAEYAARIPIGRFGTTTETAELAMAMLTSGYLTGKVYLLDGGIHPH